MSVVASQVPGATPPPRRTLWEELVENRDRNALLNPHLAENQQSSPVAQRTLPDKPRRSPEQAISNAPQRSEIFVVDDDPMIRTALKRLIASAGHDVRTFGSAEEFLATAQTCTPACVVLDVRLPGLDGIELHQRLQAGDSLLPVIFMTGYGDIPSSVLAMQSGAVDYLPKPVSDQTLLEAIDLALEVGAQSRAQFEEQRELERRIDTLTPRELEVFGMVMAARLNKQIARAMGISEKTVKVHRARLMAKMGARHVAQLVKLGVQLGMVKQPEIAS